MFLDEGIYALFGEKIDKMHSSVVVRVIIIRICMVNIMQIS